jgi:hypothetical protein
MKEENLLNTLLEFPVDEKIVTVVGATCDANSCNSLCQRSGD